MIESAAVLTREIRVLVIDVSGSGCLIESPRRLEPGTVGQLRCRFGTEEYTDDIQVVRCQEIKGAGAVFHVGLQYLWTTTYHAGSIRHGVRRLVAMLFGKHTGRVM